MWTCSHCSQLIEDDHDVCWKCCYSRDGTPPPEGLVPEHDANDSNDDDDIPPQPDVGDSDEQKSLSPPEDEAPTTPVAIASHSRASAHISKRYQVLRAVAMLFWFAGCLIAGVTLLIAWKIATIAGIGDLTLGSIGAFWICLAYGLTFACPLLAIGGVIKVLIDIEQNTRTTHELLRALSRHEDG